MHPTDSDSDLSTVVFLYTFVFHHIDIPAEDVKCFYRTTMFVDTGACEADLRPSPLFRYRHTKFSHDTTFTYWGGLLVGEFGKCLGISVFDPLSKSGNKK